MRADVAHSEIKYYLVKLTKEELQILKHCVEAMILNHEDAQELLTQSDITAHYIVYRR